MVSIIITSSYRFVCFVIDIDEYRIKITIIKNFI